MGDSEALARAIEIAPAPGWIAGSALDRLCPNAALRFLLGLNEAGLARDQWLARLRPDDAAAAQARWERPRDGWEAVFAVQTPSGPVTVNEVVSRVGAHPDAGYVGWLRVLPSTGPDPADLAERFAAANEAVFTMLSDGTMASWNPGAAALFGYTSDDVVGRPADVLLPPGAKRASSPLLAAASPPGGRTFDAVVRNRLGDDIEVHATAMPFESEGISGQVLMLRDVSQQRRRERELRAANDRARREVAELNQQLRQRLADLETLLEVVPVGIGIASDAACSEIRVNPSLARMLRIPPGANASLTGPHATRLPFRAFQGDEEIPPAALPMQHAATSGAIVTNELLTIRFDDGTAVELLEFAAPLRDEENRPRGSVGVFIDVTEQRSAEEALRKANAIKDEFLALVSHELRTPMAVVLGLSRLLRRRIDHLDTASRDEALEQLQSDAERLASLIENMLILARIDYEQRVDLEPLTLGRLLERIAADHQQRFGRSVPVELAPDLPVVEANETWVEQIVVNLLNNGEKYGLREAPILIRAEPDGDDLVRVAVITRSESLREDDLPELFEPFVRAGNASRRPGLGVGLTVCRRLAEAQGGTIAARLLASGELEVAFTLHAVPEPD